MAPAVPEWTRQWHKFLVERIGIDSLQLGLLLLMLLSLLTLLLSIMSVSLRFCCCPKRSGRCRRRKPIGAMPSRTPTNSFTGTNEERFIGILPNKKQMAPAVPEWTRQWHKFLVERIGIDSLQLGLFLLMLLSLLTLLLSIMSVSLRFCCCPKRSAGRCRRRKPTGAMPSRTPTNSFTGTNEERRCLLQPNGICAVAVSSKAPQQAEQQQLGKKAEPNAKHHHNHQHNLKVQLLRTPLRHHSAKCRWHSRPEAICRCRVQRIFLSKVRRRQDALPAAVVELKCSR
uniref:Transmembrane protein n=1 Tax=Globodera pallida TaxID=36090 RepID=A0A183BN30_GLOPA